MAEYGMGLDEALDVPDDIAGDLLKHAARRRFINHENLASLIQAKVGELLSGKPAKYTRPFEGEEDMDYAPKVTPLSEAGLGKLEGLTKL